MQFLSERLFFPCSTWKIMQVCFLSCCNIPSRKHCETLCQVAQLKKKTKKKICYKILTTEQTEVSRLCGWRCRTAIVFWVYSPFWDISSQEPTTERRKDVYRVSTHKKTKKTARLCEFVSVCIWSNGSDDLYMFFVFQICIRVFNSLDILRACFFCFCFFVNHLLGWGRFGLIYQIWFLFLISVLLWPIEKCNEKSEQLIVGIWKKTNTQLLTFYSSSDTVYISIIIPCNFLLVYVGGLDLLSLCWTLVSPPLRPLTVSAFFLLRHTDNWRMSVQDKITAYTFNLSHSFKPAVSVRRC